MVACAIQKNLRLVVDPAKRARMNDPRPVALEFCSIGMTWFRIFPAARVSRFLSKRRQHCALSHFHLLARFPIFSHLWDCRSEERRVGKECRSRCTEE